MCNHNSNMMGEQTSESQPGGGPGGKSRKGPGAGVRIAAVVVIAIVIIGAGVFGCSAWIAFQTQSEIDGTLQSHDDIFTTEEIDALKSIKPECIMVLGASVLSDGTPSDMLKDRLDAGIALYRAGVAPKLLLTGDNGQVEYNEVEAMLQYAVAGGVPAEDVFLDHAGFSTYESIYRAKAIFQVEAMVVVTQRYHLFRALYGCEHMGITALGAAADQQQYRGRQYRELREVLARDKDMLKWMIKPDPTYLGDPIPMEGDGTVTH